jgi:UDP-sugar transporter A1/2/3
MSAELVRRLGRLNPGALTNIRINQEPTPASLQQADGNTQDSNNGPSDEHLVSATTDHTNAPSAVPQQNTVLGLTAVGVSCLTSGFAGVYFERIIKQTSTSLWIRNIQLGIFSILFSLIGMWIQDGTEILRHGFFHGYTMVTWCVVVNQAVGGLAVALVVKYTDNIMKGFATSVR